MNNHGGTRLGAGRPKKVVPPLTSEEKLTVLNNSRGGGIRPGAGRPKGTKNKIRIARTMTLYCTKDDLAKAKCADPRHCALALAVDRQLHLDSRGYIHVDANEVAYTDQYGTRWYWHPTAALASYVRVFDEIGAEKGEEVARASMPEKGFSLTLVRYSPKKSYTPEQREQRNTAQRNSRKKQRAGLPMKQRKYLRYTGI